MLVEAQLTVGEQRPELRRQLAPQPVPVTVTEQCRVRAQRGRVEVDQRLVHVEEDGAYHRVARSSPDADRSRASVRSRPSSSIDSNSGGETVRPVTATRTGPNALPGLEPERPSTSAARSASSIAGVVQSASAAQRGRGGVEHAPTRPVASCLAAAASSTTDVVDEQEAGACPTRLGERRASAPAPAAQPPTSSRPASAATPTQRGVVPDGQPLGELLGGQQPQVGGVDRLGTSSRSNRAGLALTSATSNAATISLMREDVAVVGDRPAEQRQVVEQALGQVARARGSGAARTAGRAWTASCCPRP